MKIQDGQLVTDSHVAQAEAAQEQQRFSFSARAEATTEATRSHPCWAEILQA